MEKFHKVQYRKILILKKRYWIISLILIFLDIKFFIIYYIFSKIYRKILKMGFSQSFS